MQKEEKLSRRANPKEHANILSKIFFCYTSKLFVRGFREELEEEDLYQVLSNYKSEKLGQSFETVWQEDELKTKKYWIFRMIWRCYGSYYIGLGIFKTIMNLILLVLEPYALSKLVSFFVPNQNYMTKTDAYVYAFILIGTKLLKAVFTNNLELLIAALGIKVRAGLSSFIYTKVVQLRQCVSIGKVVTFLSKDVQIFELLIRYFNDIWIGIINAAFVCYLVYRKAGVSAFAGIAAFVLYIPVEAYMASKAVGYKTEMCRRSDIRLQLVQEVLAGVRLIKMNCWEGYFKQKLHTVRKWEIASIFKVLFWRLAVLVIGNTSVHLGLFFFLLTYRLLGNEITAEIVFFVLQIFRNLSNTLSATTPAGLLAVAESIASSRRIETLLHSSSNKLPRHKSAEPVVCLKNINILLKGKQILDDISFFIDKGLTVITGPVGGGKTSLLKTILGDYTSKSGYIIVHGEISYASQTPWLFPATIKQNILLWQDYKEERYLEVLKICDLVYDLELLENGDETVVEDNGENLSKGQQIRINLARALYKNSDIYLIDDCLSGLDAEISSSIFEKAIRKFLKKKVVIFVSHNKNYSRQADIVLVLENGTLRTLPKTGELDRPSPKIESKMEQLLTRPEIETTTVDETTSLLPKKEQAKVYHEDKKKGKVVIRNYHSYLKYGGGYFFILITLLGYILALIVTTFVEKLISKWVNLESVSVTTSTTYQEKNKVYYLYCFMVAASTFCFWFKFYSVYWSARRVSINLHKKISSTLVDATMRFFDQHFIGNMLNRFCRDFIVIDEHIPYAFLGFLTALTATIGILILIVTVNVTFLLPAAVYFLLLFLTRWVYIRTGRSLKRLDVSTTSPVYGHMIATVEGLTTIRAFNAQEALTNKFTAHQDNYTSASYTYQCCIKAFSFVCDILCLMFVAAIILKFLLIDDGGNSPGNVGMAITQATMLSTALELGIRQWAELENQMTSVERIMEYVKANQENQSGKVYENWPSHGAIDFEGVNLYYNSPQEPVLQDVSFTVKPNEKVAIVGRTGAGKSSLINCLFRMFNFEGKITIDGCDIKTLSLHHLRSSISILPQNATLFTGTIRENIDPNGEYTDDDIWQVLDQTHMKKLTPSLDLEIKNDDKTFSDGHKQLLCLARVLVRKSKIVVFDEATANLDLETDCLIYDVLRKKFTSSTVFLITHKLQSISMCDKILVLEKGEVVEWGDREELVDRKGGALVKLLQKAGLELDM